MVYKKVYWSAQINYIEILARAKLFNHQYFSNRENELSGLIGMVKNEVKHRFFFLQKSILCLHIVSIEGYTNYELTVETRISTLRANFPSFGIGKCRTGPSSRIRVTGKSNCSS